MIEKMFECFPSPRVFKSHLPYDLVPKGCGQAAKPQARYIYVMRNPKDVAVSLFEFVAKVSGREALSWDELFELFYQGKGYLFASVCKVIYIKLIFYNLLPLPN